MSDLAEAAPEAPVPSSPATTPATGKSGGLFYTYLPHAIVFFSSACIMIVEVVAGRLIARFLGSSLYTWTSIIGVVLAGMSIGNYIGGRMADRWKPASFLGWLFLISSISCVLTLLLNRAFADLGLLKGWTWPMRVFGSVTVIFTLPALVLGTISPAVAKMALDRSDRVGATIGSVYAWGTVGSIFGTLLTGFFLVATLGAKGVVLFTAMGLGLIGWAMGPARWAHAIWLAILFFLLMFSQSDSTTAQRLGPRIGIREIENESILFQQDSHYQFVKVEEVPSRESDRNVRRLSLDYLIHGYVDLTTPEHLEYDYEVVYREIALRYSKGKPRLDTFFIGGGSYTFPRWVMHRWPESSADVAEIDPMVLEANHAAMGLPRDTKIRTFAMDARNAVDDLPEDRRYDLIFGDAFNDLSVPYHLTTVEFSADLAKHLKPDGAYLMNIIDDWATARLLGAMVETLKAVRVDGEPFFKHIYVFCTEKRGVKEGRETFVVAASPKAVDFTDLAPRHRGPLQVSLLTDENLVELELKSGGRILTDDNAPVENLLEPVVRHRK